MENVNYVLLGPFCRKMFVRTAHKIVTNAAAQINVLHVKMAITLIQTILVHK